MMSVQNCQFKIDMRNLTNFDSKLESIKNLHFNGLLLTRLYNVWAKNYIGVMYDDTEYWSKMWRKTDLSFQKCYEEFSKFSPEHVRKSKNWDFDGILLSKVENAWA